MSKPNKTRSDSIASDQATTPKDIPGFLSQQMYLSAMPPATRPPELVVKEDIRLFEIADCAGRDMATRLAALALSKRTTEDVRNTLLAWCGDLTDTINNSDRWQVALEALAASDPATHDHMREWLNGSWSSRPALVEMLWRLNLHPTLIPAALSLHDAAGVDQVQATRERIEAPVGETVPAWEAARMVGKTYREVVAACSSGVMPSSRTGQCWKVKLVDLHAWRDRGFPVKPKIPAKPSKRASRA